MTRFANRLSLLLILVSLCGTACKKRSPGTETPAGTILPAPEVKDESGWPVHEVQKEGFALALPPDWRQFDLTPGTFEKTFQEAMKANPQLEPMFGNLRQQIAAGVKFFGIDESSMKTGFTTNVNVLRLPLPPGGTLDALAADTHRTLESMPNVPAPITRERVKTAAGDSERIRYKMHLQLPKGRTGLAAITQFHFATNTDGYVVTLTTTADREDRYLATFDKIGQSFRFIK